MTVGTWFEAKPESRRQSWQWLWVLGGISASLWFTVHAAVAQPDPPAAPPASAVPTPAPEAPRKVEVEPVARDEQIRERLVKILEATGWFSEPSVEVDEGVIFLQGRTDEERSKQWASELARNVEGSVAVVNRMEVVTPTIWDFSPAWDELEGLVQTVIRALPLIVLALIVLLLGWIGAKIMAHTVRRIVGSKLSSPLLLEVAARTCGILVFLLGLYLVLRLSGLTRLAVTVVGGTGLVGLVLGIAFRDITENFLASLFLSFQHPFREGDLVEIAATTGYIQRLTSRTTVLMTLDGNQVQIPNSMVFKSTIRNYTSNPNRREDFLVGVGYTDSIPHAQTVALQVLADHPAVLKDPEPWVLVESLGAATVNLRVYFWLDGSEHSWLKVRSSVIRLIKRAFQDAGVSLPDEAREIVFPDGVPVRMLDRAEVPQAKAVTPAPAPAAPGPEAVTTDAEAGLKSEAGEIQEQARRSWSPDRGENLLSAGKD